MATKKEPDALLPRIHLEEFVGANTDLDVMQKSGFKVFCGNKEWMRLEEWQGKMEEYLGEVITEEK